MDGAEPVLSVRTMASRPRALLETCHEYGYPEDGISGDCGCSEDSESPREESNGFGVIPIEFLMGIGKVPITART